MTGPSNDEQRVWTLRLDGAHPAENGPLALDLRVRRDGDRELITYAEPQIQPIHRGVEKLFESRDYRQCLMLADRHDWFSAFGSELGLALTMEAMLGLSVPERADWIRTMFAELNRAIHHFRWLGETAWAVSGNASLRAAATQARESLTDLHELASGGRLHPMLVTPGGLRSDLGSDWFSACAVAIPDAVQVAVGLMTWAEQATDLADVAVLTEQDAIGYATSGPVANASGLGLDLRFDDPYCKYQELADSGVLEKVTRTAGDAQARMQVLAEQLRISLACVTECADRLREIDGPISVRLPRSVRVPEGSGYGWTENPTGINGWYLISRGAPEPYRLKLRTASFNNAQALANLLPGTDTDDLPATLMSFMLVSGDLGK